MTICTAQAYATSGDLGSARSELERLLAANTRDTQLLQQCPSSRRKRENWRAQPDIKNSSPSWLPATTVRHGWRSCISLRRAGGSPGCLVQNGRGQERGASDLPGDRQPAVAEKGPAGDGSHRVDAAQDPRDWEALYRQAWRYWICESPRTRCYGSRRSSTCRPATMEKERHSEGVVPRSEAPGRRLSLDSGRIRSAIDRSLSRIGSASSCKSAPRARSRRG